MKHLEKNLLYLSHIDKVLTERIKSVPAVSENGTIKILESPVGAPTLKTISYDGIEVPLHSLYDPVTEARRFVETKDLLGNTDSYCIAGFGFGYHALELLNRIKQDKWLTIIEAREDIFRAAMENVDLSALLSRPKTRIFVGQSKGQFVSADWPLFLDWVKNFLNDSEVENITLITHAPSVRLLPEFYKNVNNEMSSAVNRRRVELVTLLKHGETLERNIINNISDIVRSAGVRSFEDKLKGIPAIVVAAGPSLNNAISFLKTVKGKAFIICVGKVLKLLLDSGIKPEFTAALDMLEDAKVFFDLPQYENALRDVALLYDPDSSYAAVSSYKGDKVVFETIVPLSGWLKKFIGEKGELSKGLSVAHISFFFARATGANPIILVGVDLALPTERTHADGSVMTWGGAVKKDDPDQITVPSVRGTSVRSLKSFQSFINAFEIEVANTKATVINTSEVGANIRGTINMPLAECIEKYCRDEKPVADIIKKALSEERPFDRDVFARSSEKLLHDIDMIIELADKGLRHLKQLSRFDRTNKRDEVEFKKIGPKVNSARYDILRLENTLPLLQRVMANDSLYIKGLNKQLEGIDKSKDINSYTKKEMERVEGFFKGYQKAARFFKTNLEPVREKLLKD